MPSIRAPSNVISPLRGRSAPAHVVNLGHGVPPSTDPGVLTRLVELVHTL